MENETNGYNVMQAHMTVCIKYTFSKIFSKWTLLLYNGHCNYCQVDMKAWHSCKHSITLAVGTDAEKLSIWPYLVFSQNGFYIVKCDV